MKTAQIGVQEQNKKKIKKRVKMDQIRKVSVMQDLRILLIDDKLRELV